MDEDIVFAQEVKIINDRLDVIESNIEKIASFLRTKSSTLGETFPEQQHRKAQEAVDGVEQQS